jgi:regulator of replication initiation timing
MSQPIKITDAEFSEIRKLQEKFHEMVIKMGSLQFEKMELDQTISDFVEREKKLREEWLTLKKQDEGLRDKIVTTYGEGSLNMENGTFIPAATSPPTPQPSK